MFRSLLTPASASAGRPGGLLKPTPRTTSSPPSASPASAPFRTLSSAEAAISWSAMAAFPASSSASAPVIQSGPTRATARPASSPALAPTGIPWSASPSTRTARASSALPASPAVWAARPSKTSAPTDRRSRTASSACGRSIWRLSGTSNYPPPNAALPIAAASSTPPISGRYAITRVRYSLQTRRPTPSRISRRQALLRRARHRPPLSRGHCRRRPRYPRAQRHAARSCRSRLAQRRLLLQEPHCPSGNRLAPGRHRRLPRRRGPAVPARLVGRAFGAVRPDGQTFRGMADRARRLP